MDERKKSERRMARVPRREGLHLLPEPTKSPPVRSLSAGTILSLLLNLIVIALFAFMALQSGDRVKSLQGTAEALQSENRTLTEDLDTARANWGHSLKENKKLQHQMDHTRELLKADKPWVALKYLTIDYQDE